MSARWSNLPHDRRLLSQFAEQIKCQRKLDTCHICHETLEFHYSLTLRSRSASVGTCAFRDGHTVAGIFSRLIQDVNYAVPYFEAKLKHVRDLVGVKKAELPLLPAHGSTTEVERNLLKYRTSRVPPRHVRPHERRSGDQIPGPIPTYLECGSDQAAPRDYFKSCL